jgi:hypothetical protein
MCWHSFIKESHITTTASRTSSFAAILESTAVGESPKVNQRRWTKVGRRPTCSPVNPVDHFRWKELFTRFTLVDSTALINLGDPCKRALRLHSPRGRWLKHENDREIQNCLEKISSQCQIVHHKSHPSVKLYTTNLTERPGPEPAPPPWNIGS